MFITWFTQYEGTITLSISISQLPNYGDHKNVFFLNRFHVIKGQKTSRGDKTLLMTLSIIKSNAGTLFSLASMPCIYWCLGKYHSFYTFNIYMFI